jgi:hypothetical protein
MIKLATCTEAAIAKAAALSLLLNIFPNITQTTGPQEKPKQKT